MKREASTTSVTSNGKTSACYTAPLAPMPASSSTKFIATWMLLSAGFSLAQESPNPFTPQATQLVTEVMNRAGAPGFVTLDVQNKSSLSANDVTLARKALEAQLRATSARLVKPERAVAEISVTISENLQGLLWVAE